MSGNQYGEGSAITVDVGLQELVVGEAFRIGQDPHPVTSTLSLPHLDFVDAAAVALPLLRQ